MRIRSALAVALLVGPLVAQEPKEELLEEPIVPSFPGSIARGARPADAGALEVRLLQGGALQVREGEAWNDVTLDGLGAALGAAAQAYDARQRARGGSGYETLPGGVRASRLYVSIRADPLVPWQHVQWVMIVAAEHYFYRMELRSGGRALRASLPRDVAVEPGVPNHITASVHVVARKETPIQWGDVRVNHPSVVRYRFGDQEAAALADVRRWLVEAREAAAGAAADLEGELKAGFKVPFARVFELAELFADVGYERFVFFGAPLPGAAQRRMKRLPYPKHN